jgi:hypothetical protein
VFLAKIRFDDTDDLIDICMDNVFKAVFTRNTPESQGALSNLLSALIGREVAVTNIIVNEPPIDNIRDRQIRFDINCRVEDGELIEVEMSLNPDIFEPIRLEFLMGKLFTGQDIRGKDSDGFEKSFDDLKRAYQIAFLVKSRFFSDEVFFHIFEYYDPEHKMSLNGRTRIIILELSKLDKVLEKPIGRMTAPEHWAVFFRYLTDKSKRKTINEILEQEEGITMASEVLMTISKDEIERHRLMDEYMGQLDAQSKIGQARREERKKGREEGRGEERQAIARNLKAIGIPIGQIAQGTGLTEARIKEL